MKKKDAVDIFTETDLKFHKNRYTIIRVLFRNDSKIPY